MVTIQAFTSLFLSPHKASPTAVVITTCCHHASLHLTALVITTALTTITIQVNPSERSTKIAEGDHFQLSLLQVDFRNHATSSSDLLIFLDMSENK